MGGKIALQRMSENMVLTIWHNPRCSKSRQTLELLVGKGHEPEIIDYQKSPPSILDIQKAHELLGGNLRDMVRTGDDLYKALDADSLSDADLISVLGNHPKLIERPIVFNGDKAAIGRPPETVLKILD